MSDREPKPHLSEFLASMASDKLDDILEAELRRCAFGPEASAHPLIALHLRALLNALDAERQAAERVQDERDAERALRQQAERERDRYKRECEAARALLIHLSMMDQGLGHWHYAIPGIVDEALAWNYVEARRESEAAERCQQEVKP